MAQQPTSSDLETGPSEFTRAVGAELRRILTEKGIHQKDLAEMTGVPASNVSLIVQGKKNASMARIEMLFSALGYRLDVSATEIVPQLRRSQKRARDSRLPLGTGDG